jgi:anti-anti-sigma factor
VDPLLGPVTIIERAPGRFSITGELDMTTASRLSELHDVHGPLLLDLHGVTFIDSKGIAALLRLHRRCEHDGCSFRIEAWSDQVERVLRIVGLHVILTEDGVGHGPDLPPSAPEREAGLQRATERP